MNDSMFKESGIKSGRWMPLIKLVIYYGGFTKSVFWLISNYNHDMYNVSWSVLGVIWLFKMIGILLWVVRWHVRVDIGQGFRLCCNNELELWAVWPIFLFDIWHSESRDIAGRVALLLWKIWAARNDFIWNDAHHTSTEIGRTALDAWQQWQEVHKHHSPSVVQHRQNRVQVWEKPNESWLKCNVGAAFHDRNHITSFACCVRDSRGQFIRAQTKWQWANMTVLEGEAIALLEALHFADANRWDRVVFESDSSTLVQALSFLGYGDS